MKKRLIQAAGETVLAESKHTKWGYIGAVAAGVVLWIVGVILFLTTRGNPFASVGSFAAILCVVGGVLLAFLLVFSLKSEKVVITDKRIYTTKGFLATHSVSIPISQADTVNVNRSLFGAIFRYSSIEIVAAGTAKIAGGNTVPEKFSFLVNAEKLREVFFQAISEEKDTRSSH